MKIDTGAHGAAAFTGLVLQDTYTLGPSIGQGGMGVVYEATHARLPGRMAVKILLPHLRTNEDAFARFCREAAIMSGLQHPNIIQIVDFNTSASLDGLPYFVMEYLDGDDLERRLGDSGPLSLAATIRIVDAVASALSAAHAAGVVHRDLKPANIFLTRGEGPDADFVKVIDFGISKPQGFGPELSTASDVVFGTPSFMAPEQALGLVREVDARTDQFALAAITYAMLAGRQPFVGETAAALLYQVVHQPHPPLSRFVSWDTTPIQTVLDRGLAKRRQDRFASVVEFARALNAAAAISTDRHPRSVEARESGPAKLFGDADLPRSIDRVPHGPQRAVALGLAVLGLAAFVGYKGWGHGLGGRVVETEQRLSSGAGDKWRAFKSNPSVSASKATPLPIASPEIEPAVAERPPSGEERVAVRKVSARRFRPLRAAVSRSGWQTIQIVSLPASSPSGDAADSPEREADAPPPTAAPDGFAIPGPPPPAAGDLAPAPPDPE